MTDRVLYQDKNKSRKVENEKGKEVFVYKYEYNYTDGTKRTVVKKYIPSENKRYRQKQNEYLELDKTINMMRKSIARCLHYSDINIDKNIINNPAKNKPDIVLVEEVSYRVQEVIAHNMIINFLEYMLTNKIVYFALKKKYPKLLKSFVEMAKEKYGICIEDVVK